MPTIDVTRLQPGEPAQKLDEDGERMSRRRLVGRAGLLGLGGAGAHLLGSRAAFAQEGAPMPSDERPRGSPPRGPS